MFGISEQQNSIVTLCTIPSFQTAKCKLQAKADSASAEGNGLEGSLCDQGDSQEI